MQHPESQITILYKSYNLTGAFYNSSRLRKKCSCATMKPWRETDTYVIFITEKDYYQAGKAVYMIQNMNRTLNQPFDDGAHILYVNGEYRDDSAIGKLMHDFNCTNADDMHYELMAERTRYLKENSKGVDEMYRTMDEVEKECYEEGREAQADMTAVNLRKLGLTSEQIARAVGFRVEKVETWIK